MGRKVAVVTRTTWHHESIRWRRRTPVRGGGWLLVTISRLPLGRGIGC